MTECVTCILSWTNVHLMCSFVRIDARISERAVILIGLLKNLCLFDIYIYIYNDLI